LIFGRVRFARLFGCRGCPAGRLLFLLRQEKLTKRRRPHPPPLRGSLRCSPNRAAAELGLRPQTVLAEIPRPGCAARRWTKGRKTNPTPPTQPSPRGGHPKIGLRPQDQSLLRRLGFPENSGAVGEDCLSALREFRSRPDFQENRGKPEGPARQGRLLLVNFSWRSKKSNLPAGQPRHLNICA